MRKLVTVQKILEVKEIPGADKITEARVMGWRVVIKKGEFVAGNWCLFFEVDSILPEAPWSQFMRPRKFRVKTAKLRGVLSQGLALPLSILTEEQKKKIELVEGFDATSILGVSQYEPPILDLIGGHVEHEGPFPSHVPKTDEERIQSQLEWLMTLHGRPYTITVKVDGSSMTVCYDDDDRFLVCSRNFSIKHTPDQLSKHWILIDKYQLRDKLKGTGIAIQGELVGPGIQKNRLRLTEPECLVFNVFDWKNRRHFSLSEAEAFCKSLGLRTVPIEEAGENFSYDLNQLLEKAKGVYHGTQNLREGIVVRSVDKPRVSFKVLNNDFLLKEEE